MVGVTAEPVECVLFDLGGVLIDWNPRHLYRQVFTDAAEMEHFLAVVCPPDWNHILDEGRSFRDAVAERQALFPSYAAAIALWHEQWERMLGGAIEPTLDLLAALRARGHRLVALTNWSAETFPIARARYDFLSWFEDIVVSGEVKLAKPDPRIFELTRTRAGLDPSRTLFIDDSEKNIAAASALGYQTHRFARAPGLEAVLRTKGLLTAG